MDFSSFSWSMENASKICIRLAEPDKERETAKRKRNDSRATTKRRKTKNPGSAVNNWN